MVKDQRDKGAIRTFLLKHKNASPSVGELSRLIDRSKETVVKFLASLRADGMDVGIDRASKKVVVETVSSEPKILHVTDVFKRTLKFGVISDTHLTSRYQQLSLLHHVYKVFAEEECAFAVHLGDLSDGNGKMYPGHLRDLFLHSAPAVVRYIVKNYPRWNRNTYVIAGNHDVSFKKALAVNVVRTVCEQRPDLVYLGDIQATLDRGGLRIWMHHPSVGLAYAKSYHIQRIAEAVVGDALEMFFRGQRPENLPQICLFGHLHQAIYLSHMGMECFLCPCLQANTPYLRAKGYFPVLGAWIIEVKMDKGGCITEIVPKRKDFSRLVTVNDGVVDAEYEEA